MTLTPQLSSEYPTENSIIKGIIYLKVLFAGFEVIALESRFNYGAVSNEPELTRGQIRKRKLLSLEIINITKIHDF